MDNEVAILFIVNAAGVIKKASIGMARALGHDSPACLSGTSAWDCLPPAERVRVIAWAKMPHGCIYYNRSGVGRVCASAMEIKDSLLFVIEHPIGPNENFKPVKSDLGLQHDSNFCVIQVDTHLRVKYWNLAAASFTEVAPRQAIGKSLVELPDMGCTRLLHNMLKVWFELAYLLEEILAM